MKGLYSKATLESLKIQWKRHYYAKQGRDYDAEMLEEQQAKEKAKAELKTKKELEFEEKILAVVANKNITIFNAGRATWGGNWLWKINGKRASQKVVFGVIKYFLENQLYDTGATLLLDYYDGNSVLSSIGYMGDSEEICICKIEQAKKITWAEFDDKGKIEKIKYPYFVKTLYNDEDDFEFSDIENPSAETIATWQSENLIDRLSDFYMVDADAAAEVEVENAKMANLAVSDKLKAKIAEQKNKPRKSIIDWTTIDEDNEVITPKAEKKAA